MIPHACPDQVVPPSSDGCPLGEGGDRSGGSGDKLERQGTLPSSAPLGEIGDRSDSEAVRMLLLAASGLALRRRQDRCDADAGVQRLRIRLPRR